MDELFQKERPKKITEKQREKMYVDIAQEIVYNEWCNISYCSQIYSIIKDLKTISFKDSGYEIAKELESHKCRCSYEIDTDFIEFLDSLQYREREILDKNIAEWVKRTKPLNIFQIGTKLKIASKFTRSYNVGDIVHVNTIYFEHAQYGISYTEGSKTNTLIDFEVLEGNTIVIE